MSSPSLKLSLHRIFRALGIHFRHDGFIQDYSFFNNQRCDDPHRTETVELMKDTDQTQDQVSKKSSSDLDSGQDCACE